MPTVVIRHQFDLASPIRGEYDDLTVVDAATAEEAVEALSARDARMLVVANSDWEEAYLEGLSEGDWVQTTSTGYDDFPLDAFEERGIRFTNAVGNYGPIVSEHTFALAFAISRRLPTLIDRQREHVWDRSIGETLTDWKDRTCTVVGLGDIGEEVARRALAFEMDVYGIKRDPGAYDGRLDPDRVLRPAALDRVLPETDLLVLSVPLTEETRHMIDRDAFEALPDSAVLINVARGEVVEEAALLDALDAGELAAAGLDVFHEEPLPPDSPLWDHDDVLLTTHIAGRSDRFAGRFADLFLENYGRWRRGDPLTNQVV